MCVFTGLQVCFHSAMKHENDVSDMISCLRVVRRFTVRASYIVSFFIKIENNNFIKVYENSRAGENMLYF